MATDRREPSATVMPVGDWMAAQPVTVSPDDDVATARELMRSAGVRHLPVVDGDDRLVGILSDRDVRIDDASLNRLRAVERLDELAGRGRSVEAVMTEDVQVVGERATVADAARTMLSHRVSAVPVVDGDRRLLGIVTTTDCLLASLWDVGILDPDAIAAR